VEKEARFRGKRLTIGKRWKTKKRGEDLNRRKKVQRFIAHNQKENAKEWTGIVKKFLFFGKAGGGERKREGGKRSLKKEKRGMEDE